MIESFIPEIPLFEKAKLDNLLFLAKTEFVGSYYTFLYEVITELLSQIGLDKINRKLLLDLVVIRVVEPDSKSRSIEL